MSVIDRYCIVCSAFFRPVRRDNVYCSGACKQKAWRLRGGAAARGIKQSPPGIDEGNLSLGDFFGLKPFMERRK